MSILNKTHAIDKTTSDITGPNSDNLKPTTNFPIKDTNLSAYLQNFINWIFKNPTPTADLSGKVLTVERTGTPNIDFSNLLFLTMIPLGGIMMYGANGWNREVGGVIKAMVGSNELEGFLFLDGSTIPNIDTTHLRYKSLKMLLDGSYGNLSSVPNTLYLPDMRGKVPLGYDNTTTGTNSNVGVKNYQNCGNTGGTSSVQLGINNIPSHNHGGSLDITTPNLPNITAVSFGSSNSSGVPGLKSENINQIGTLRTKQIPTEGGNNPHENRQEYMVVNYIIRYI